MKLIVSNTIIISFFLVTQTAWQDASVSQNHTRKTKQETDLISELTGVSQDFFLLANSKKNVMDEIEERRGFEFKDFDGDSGKAWLSFIGRNYFHYEPSVFQKSDRTFVGPGFMLWNRRDRWEINFSLTEVQAKPRIIKKGLPGFYTLNTKADLFPSVEDPERALLNSLFINRRGYLEVERVVSIADFKDPINQFVFNEIILN